MPLTKEQKVAARRVIGLGTAGWPAGESWRLMRTGSAWLPA